MATLSMAEEALLFGPGLADLQQQAAQRTSTEEQEHQQNKRLRTDQPGQQTVQGQGKARTKGARQRSRASSQVDDVTIQMAKLVLRHEDQLARIQTDTLHVFQLRSCLDRADSVLPLLYQTVQDWKQRYQLNPAGVNKTMRQTVLLRLIMELKKRASNMSERREANEVLKSKGWMTDQGAWVHVRWNAETQTQERVGDTTKAPQEFLAELNLAQELLQHPEVLTRFQATRPITASMQGQVTTSMCELAIRSEEATKLHRLFRSWVGLSALLLVQSLQTALFKRSAQFGCETTTTTVT